MREPTTRYCFLCGTAMVMVTLEERMRLRCPACGWVYYPQLKVAAAAQIEQHGRLLLVRRAMQPWLGCWNLPAGYLEADEDPHAGAAREAFEETGLLVKATDLLQAYYFDDDPRGNGVLLVYATQILGGEIHGSPEGREIRFFNAQELPAPQAGAGHQQAIQAWLDSKTNGGRPSSGAV
jgi:8-oxo-dGTP diphosphatase